MLDLFTIFSKGGIVLWCFQSTSQLFTPSVNALITSVILQVIFYDLFSVSNSQLCKTCFSLSLARGQAPPPLRRGSHDAMLTK